MCQKPQRLVAGNTKESWIREAGSVTASKDDAPAAVQAAIHNVAELWSSSIGGGLIQTTSG